MPARRLGEIGPDLKCPHAGSRVNESSSLSRDLHRPRHEKERQLLDEILPKVALVARWPSAMGYIWTDH
jgi:hypothetical protein